MPPLSIPPHKQTDPAKRPGQIVNPIPLTAPGVPPHVKHWYAFALPFLRHIQIKD